MNIFKKIKHKYSNQPINDIDGLKIEFDKEWVQLRRSNTEPIVRIYAESSHQTTAEGIARQLMSDINEIVKTL